MIGAETGEINFAGYIGAYKPRLRDSCIDRRIGTTLIIINPPFGAIFFE